MALRLKSMNINEHLWYYEVAKGINVVYKVLDKSTGAYIRTDQFIIPWKRLLESVNRKYDKQRNK